MSATATTIQDRTASVNPEIICQHPDDVLSVKALSDFVLEVVFVDGTKGRVQLQRLVHSEAAGVFASLRDETAFRNVSVVLGAVTWGNGVDLAPDVMYQSLRSDGEWIL